VEDIDMQTITALCAIGLAIVLVGLQIVLGLEYTDGGSFGTQASMVVGMVTLALLPVFIETARRYGLPLLGWALVVPFCAFLVYSLPATTGRTGEIKETKVAAAADVALWKAEIASLTKSLGWARPEQAEQCLGAPSPLPPNGWPKCRRATASVTAFTERLGTLEGKVKAVGSNTGDMGSDLWAWAIGAEAATVRKVSVLAFAIGLDFAIWALIWLATAMLGRKQETVSIKPAANDTAQTSFPVPPNGGNRRPAYTRAAASADVVALVGRGQPIPSQKTLSERWGVPKGTTAKWLRRFEADGLIVRETVGRCKVVRAA
jgi:hypothetical protein